MKNRFDGFRRRRVLGMSVLVLCLLPGANLVMAGQAQEAAIIGQVTDESGAVLPGVTVTATSLALQVPAITDVTTERGEYRLTPLPIGTYTVQYELSGFGTVRREDIRLTAGFTARVDVALKVGTLAETVTVSGAAPVVDVTSTASRTQLTRETLEIIPTGRGGYQAILAQAPGVRTNLDVGGNTTATNPTFRAFGQNGDAWSALEGVLTNSPKSGTQGGNYVDYSVIEEATVQTVGSSAEAPTRGIQLNAILKSGGNDFHGAVYWAQSSKGLQSDNVDDRLRAQGFRSGNPVVKRWDLSGELGGRVIRNKLWFYYSARGRRDTTGVLGNVVTPDGSPATNTSLHRFSTIKLSYQMSSANKLIGFWQRYYRTGVDSVSQFVPWDSRTHRRFTVDTSKLEWQVAKGNTFASLQGGAWIWDALYTGYSTAVGTVDQLTFRESGLPQGAGSISFEGRRHAKGVVSWYKPDLFLGNHEVKAGFDYAAAYAGRVLFDRQVLAKGQETPGLAPNYQLIFRNQVPFQLAAWNAPVYPRDLTRYVGTYVQDSWTIARRLTLNLGIRYAHDNGFVPLQCRESAPPPLDVVYPAQCFPLIQFKKFNSVVPRLHAAYDVQGDGKTVVKGGWGRFAQMRYVDATQPANENVALTTFFRWHDDNGNKLFDPGEVNFQLNGPDFVLTTTQAGALLAHAVPNPNEKQQGADEYSLSVERELIPNLAVRVTGIYSRTLNIYRVQNNLRPYDVYNIPITNADPGPDGRLGTGDEPGTVITYYDFPAAYAGAAFQQPMLINDPKSNQSYKSVEVAASKRMANRWQFMASYSATKSHIPYVQNTAGVGDFVNPGITVFLTTFDPNAEIFAANDTWEWLGRVSGAYTFPADVLLSANFEHRSGIPFARTVSVTGGRQIPSITLRVEPIGTRRSPNINLLDVRAEKSFRVRQVHRVALRFNIYNALNTNTATTLTQQSGAAFLRPTVIAPPRSAEISATYSF